MTYTPDSIYTVLLGDDGWWYVLTPDEAYDRRFRKEKDAYHYCLNVEYREKAMTLLEPLYRHFDEDKRITISFPVDLFRHLYRSISCGFSNHYLYDAYLDHIESNCKTLYYKLGTWKNENPGKAEFEVDELQGCLMKMYDVVTQYKNLLEEFL